MKNRPFKHRITSNKPLSIVLQILITLAFIGVISLSLHHITPHWIKWCVFGTAMLLFTVQCIRLKSPLLLIDRIFANFPGKQVFLTLLIFMICFDFALCLFPSKGLRNTFSNFISPKVLTEEVSDGIRYEIDTIKPENDVQKYVVVKKPAQHNQWSDYLKHGIIYILGLIVFNGLLIATITRFMTTRAARYNMGVNTYRNIKNHIVIIGYNLSCVPIIRNVCNRNKSSQPPTFLILSSQNPATIQRFIQTQLQTIEEHIIVYSGDMNSMTQLRRLNINHAKEVFILGEGQEPGRDSKNLECARIIKEIRKTKSHKDTLHINVQFDKPASYSTIKRITIPDDYYKDEEKREVTYIRPFNFYENWARLLWGTNHLEEYSPLDRRMMAKGNHHVHLVIAGFNEMGTALLLEALRICHYPNYNETTGANKTKITIIDPRMDDLLPLFKSQYPYLDQITDVELDYKAYRIEDPACRMMLDQLAGQEDTLLTIAICFYDADNSFSAALTLPDTLYYHVEKDRIIPNLNTEILVRQEIRSGLATLLEQENGKFSNVKIFGTLDKGVDDNLLNDKMPIIINAYYHFKYHSNPPKDFFEMAKADRDAALKEAFVHWISLNEDQRFANRYQTEVYQQYLTYRSTFDQAPELLYQTEHLRWCAERSITGYRNLHEMNLKNSTYQIHRLIVPYQELSVFEKEKDQDVLEIMDKVIALSESLCSVSCHSHSRSGCS